MEVLSSVAVGWIDYVAQDFDNEAPIVAGQLGFSSELVSSLTGRLYLTYEDFDTEMGMRMPSIQVRQLEVEPYPLLLLLRGSFVTPVRGCPLPPRKAVFRQRSYSGVAVDPYPAEGCYAG